MAFPAWVAVIEHVPAATIVTTPPETAQTAVVVEDKVTVRPESTVAVTAKGETPKFTVLSALNVIICV